MARTATKKTIEEKEVVKEVNEDVIEKPVEKKKTEKTKKEFSEKDYILCRSVIPGELIVDGREGRRYRFKDYGSEQRITYGDLVDMVMRRANNAFIPRFIILDEDFLEEFPQVQEKYAEVFSAGNLTEILMLQTDQMIQELSKLPKEIQRSAKALIASMLDDGSIDSIAKIRALTDFYGIDFVLLSELFA